MSEQRSYDEMSAKQLKQLCKERGLTPRGNLSGQKMRDLLRNNDLETKSPADSPAKGAAADEGQQAGKEEWNLQREREKVELHLWKMRQEAEIAERAAERAERAAEKAHQRQMELAKLQRQEGRKDPPLASENSSLLISKGLERICPVFREDEDIEEFLSIFEKLCNIHQVPDEKRMPVLLTRLTGRARTVFNEMELEDALDYGKFKKGVLQRFKITPESYRLKFRKVKLSDDVTYVETAHKLLGYLKKWVEGAKACNSFSKVIDLFAREQLLEIAPHRIRAAVMDKKPDTVLEAAQIADDFMENRSWEGQKPQGKNHPYSSQVRREDESRNKTSPNLARKSYASPKIKSAHPGGKPAACFQCRQTGHIRPNCPNYRGRDNPRPATPRPEINSNAVALCTETGQVGCDKEESVSSLGIVENSSLCVQKSSFSAEREKISSVISVGPEVVLDSTETQGEKIPKPASVGGNVLPMGEVIPVPKSLSGNSHEGWDKGEETSNGLSVTSSSLSAGGEAIPRVLSVEEAESTVQLMLMQDLSAGIPEMVLDPTETQEGSGPKPVSVGGSSLPLGEAAPVSKSLSENSHVGWDKGGKIPDCLDVKKGRLPAEKEFISQLLSKEQMRWASQFMRIEGVPVVSDLVLDLSEAQKESFGAQGNVSLAQPLAEEGRDISVGSGLLPKTAPEEIKPPDGFCEQFAATEGCESELIKLAQDESLPVASNGLEVGKSSSVSNCQSFPSVDGFTDSVLERSSLDTLEKVPDGVDIFRKLKQLCSQMAVLDHYSGETMRLELECLQDVSSVSEQIVPQFQRKDWAPDATQQNSCAGDLWGEQGVVDKLSPLKTLGISCSLLVDSGTSDAMWGQRWAMKEHQNPVCEMLVKMVDVSLKPSPDLKGIAVKHLETSKLASVCVDADDMPDRGKRSTHGCKQGEFLLGVAS
ncbi:uncharacterized protein [Emydura macquarii macquarii]|uniref:uncharacterized protein n=1 Tax=Emydura macquarii macquarii TaxID=1129001 RepID=UPI00352BB4FC